MTFYSDMELAVMITLEIQNYNYMKRESLSAIINRVSILEETFSKR